MTPKAILIGFVITLGVGISFGSCAASSDPPPPKVVTQVVRVPEVKVETRMVKEATPMPSECRDAINLLQSAVENDSTISAQVGEALLALTDAEKDVVMRDIPGMTDSLQRLRDAKTKADTALIRKATDMNRLDIKLQQCKDK